MLKGSGWRIEGEGFYWVLSARRMERGLQYMLGGKKLTRGTRDEGVKKKRR